MRKITCTYCSASIMVTNQNFELIKKGLGFGYY